MSEIITSTVEKDDGHGFLKTDAIRLTEIGGGIAHTITCREGALCVQHCNLIIEVEKLEEVKVIGNYMPSEHNASRVVDDKGIAPTVMENHGTVTGVVEIQELGGLEEGSSQRRKVFDENGVSPTLQAAMGAGGGNVPLVTTVDAVIGSMQENAMVGNGEYSPSLTEAMGMGGGQIPMVVEKSSVVVQKCGDRDKEGSYSVHDYSNTIPANPMSDRGQMLVEQTCVAMRGRNPENPSDRTPGIELEQRLEVNDTGCTNTLTTVQKDNLVLEEKIIEKPLPKIKIKQATKQGFIECEIGGGYSVRNIRQAS